MAVATAAGFVSALPPGQCGPNPLVSAGRLWKDLQAFCCSKEKCNFHDNSNLNCTLKVRGGGAPECVPSAPVSVSSTHLPGSGWAHVPQVSC